MIEQAKAERLRLLSDGAQDISQLFNVRTDIGLSKET